MDVCAGVSQGSILGPLLILIYNLPGNLTSNLKMFAEITSLFCSITDPDVTADQINTDLHNINRWPYLWKVSFNPDPSTQAQEITAHPQLFLNDNPVHQIWSQKQFGMFLDLELNFY